MELAKQPETELEYWGGIEHLGGFMWRMNHDLDHGRIEDPDGSIKQDIAAAGELSEKLLVEIGEKFGVLHPSVCPQPDANGNYPTPPEGKQHYWPWYESQKKRAWEIEYENMICSACPFSNGAEALQISVPCSQASGVIYQLIAPHRCAMVDMRDWTREYLLARIARTGKGAKKKFLAKEEELKAKATAS